MCTFNCPRVGYEPVDSRGIWSNATIQTVTADNNPIIEINKLSI